MTDKSQEMTPCEPPPAAECRMNCFRYRTAVGADVPRKNFYTDSKEQCRYKLDSSLYPAHMLLNWSVVDRKLGLFQEVIND